MATVFRHRRAAAAARDLPSLPDLASLSVAQRPPSRAQAPDNERRQRQRRGTSNAEVGVVSAMNYFRSLLWPSAEPDTSIFLEQHVAGGQPLSELSPWQRALIVLRQMKPGEKKTTRTDEDGLLHFDPVPWNPACPENKARCEALDAFEACLAPHGQRRMSLDQWEETVGRVLTQHPTLRTQILALHSHRVTAGRIVAFEAEDTDGDVGETSFVAPEPPARNEYDGKNALGVRLLDYEKRMDRTGDKIIYATYYGTPKIE